ncbi:MAG TPA: hypothetical protein VKV16_01725, partial [Solirubrobacteraceae bacterium]|nr:hypothetical protein [Solirubrobacteraceae bacterium]
MRVAYQAIRLRSSGAFRDHARPAAPPLVAAAPRAVNPLQRPLAAWRQLPLWARWALTIAVYAVAILAVVLAIHAANSGGSSASKSEAHAEAEANREGRIAIAQDEAPHTAALAGTPASAAQQLQRAIAADVRARITHNQLTGPLQSVRCSAAGQPRDARQPYRCSVLSAGLDYPFLAVVDQRARRLTWCKLDPP